ncbi:MAG: ATP-binding protein [Pseudomonadota bacterium]
MMREGPALHLLCGKIAAGKSTLAARLGGAPATIVIAEDIWLKTLFGDEMATGADFLDRSARLRRAITPHLMDLLMAGVSVVLDFAANTVAQRQWMREVIDQARVAHQLHVLEVPDEVCLARLRARNVQGEHAFAATEAQFHRFTKHFVAPTPEEGFVIVRYDEEAREV